MTERTCGNCAWWDDRDKVMSSDGMWLKKASDGGAFPYIGPGRCMRDPVAVSKEPTDWCRHHATTRGWDEPSEEDLSQLGPGHLRVSIPTPTIQAMPKGLDDIARKAETADTLALELKLSKNMLGEAYSKLTSVLHYLEHTTEPPELMAGIRRWLEAYNGNEQLAPPDNEALEREIERLKDRCREARKIIAAYYHRQGVFEGTAPLGTESWLEVDDA